MNGRPSRPWRGIVAGMRRKRKRPGQQAIGPDWQRARAARADSPEVQLARRRVMLGIDERKLHDPATRRRLARGRPPYDPLRHLLLVRLERKLKKGGLRRITRMSTSQS
jgi:hypothetical protein